MKTKPPKMVQRADDEALKEAGRAIGRSLKTLGVDRQAFQLALVQDQFPKRADGGVDLIARPYTAVLAMVTQGIEEGLGVPRDQH